jgi:hypothetical protein
VCHTLLLLCHRRVRIHNSRRSIPGLEHNTLYFGGDVGRRRDDGMDTVNLLHGRADIAGIEVMKGVKLGGLADALEAIARGTANAEEFKVCV